MKSPKAVMVLNNVSYDLRKIYAAIATAPVVEVVKPVTAPGVKFYNVTGTELNKHEPVVTKVNGELHVLFGNIGGAIVKAKLLSPFAFKRSKLDD